jgi:peptidoglycan/LPS O-acetylase OafA/YrhL
MVFCWHFFHYGQCWPVRCEDPPLFFPLTLLDQGNVGVSLFMVLSGYLFSKLIAGRDINYGAFLWNRLVRLAPLLIIVFCLVGMDSVLRHGDGIGEYLSMLVKGFVLPTWPNGGWSIAIEIHFYFLLPLLLKITARFKWAPLLLVAIAIGLRSSLFYLGYDIKSLAYWTIIGRLDQFCFGILAFFYRPLFKNSHWLAATIFTVLCALCWSYDDLGGDRLMEQLHPSLISLSIVIPTIEGVLFAALVAYYDQSFSPSNAGVSGALSRIGTYSYSIYLLHFFVVFRMARFVQYYVMDMSNFYVATLWATVCFLLTAMIGSLSYKLVEKRFLRFRRQYVLGPNSSSHGLLKLWTAS